MRRPRASPFASRVPISSSSRAKSRLLDRARARTSCTSGRGEHRREESPRARSDRAGTRSRAAPRARTRRSGSSDERASMREPTRDARVEQRRLERVADLVLAIQHGDVARARCACSAAVARDVAHDPRQLGVVGLEVQRRSRANGDVAIGQRDLAVLEDRRVALDQLARESEDVARAAAVLCAGTPAS